MDAKTHDCDWRGPRGVTSVIPRPIREAEDALFGRWGSGRPSFHADGLVDEVQYDAAPIKLLFILKEVNEPADPKFDLRNFLYDGGRAQTWDNVTRWTEGMTRLVIRAGDGLCWGDFDFDHMTEDKRMARRKASLRQIGAINVKKSAGKDITDVKLLSQAALEDASRLRGQLSLYRADFTICCGSAVTDAVDRHSLVEKAVWKPTSRGVRYHLAGQHGVVIDYCHPMARGRPNLLFYGLMDAVAEILQSGYQVPKDTGRST